MLTLKNLVKSGINVIDDSNNELSNQIFKQAKKKIDDIVLANQSVKENSSYNNKYISQNVIAFTGERGTGKTTNMLSVIRKLNEHNVNENVEVIYYPLQYTDASMLDGNKDFFLVVLSKMYTYLEKKVNSSECRNNTILNERVKEVKENISKVFSHYISLNGQMESAVNPSFKIMEKTAEKFSVRENFIKLVEVYTKLLNIINKNENADGYIIVCIDDIDLALKKTPGILNEIYQYLMIPNIIVMTTLNAGFLTAIMEKHFFDEIHMCGQNDENSLKHAAYQSGQFLRKIIPAYMRIDMPSWNYIDYSDLQPITIDMQKTDIEDFEKELKRLKYSNIYKRLLKIKETSIQAENSKDRWKVSPKDLILLMIAERTEIFMNHKDRNHNIIQPTSMRHMVDMFNFFYEMNSLSEKDNYDDKLRENRKSLMDYFYHNLFPDLYLTQTMRTVVEDLFQSPMQRRFTIIWHHYYKCLKEEKERIIDEYGEEFFLKETEKEKTENFSIGEIYRILFFASRIGLKNFSQNFIEIFLMSTMVAAPQYNEWLKHPESGDNKIRIKDLSETYGNSLLGTWCDDILEKKVKFRIYIDYGLFDGFEAKIEEAVLARKEKVVLENLFSVLMLFRNRDNDSIKVDREFDRIGSLYYNLEFNADPTSVFFNAFKLENFTKAKFIKSDSTALNVRGYFDDDIIDGDENEKLDKIRSEIDEINKKIEACEEENELKKLKTDLFNAETNKEKLIGPIIRKFEIRNNLSERENVNSIDTLFEEIICHFALGECEYSAERRPKTKLKTIIEDVGKKYDELIKSKYEKKFYRKAINFINSSENELNNPVDKGIYEYTEIKNYIIQKLKENNLDDWIECIENNENYQVRNLIAIILQIEFNPKIKSDEKTYIQEILKLEKYFELKRYYINLKKERSEFENFFFFLQNTELIRSTVRHAITSLVYQLDNNIKYMKTDIEPITFIIEFYRKVSKRLKEVAEFYRGKDISDINIAFDKILENHETVKFILSDETVNSILSYEDAMNIFFLSDWFFIK